MKGGDAPSPRARARGDRVSPRARVSMEGTHHRGVFRRRRWRWGGSGRSSPQPPRGIALGSEEPIASILAVADAWAVSDKLRKPPWVGAIGSPAIQGEGSRRSERAAWGRRGGFPTGGGVVAARGGGGQRRRRGAGARGAAARVGKGSAAVRPGGVGHGGNRSPGGVTVVRRVLARGDGDVPPRGRARAGESAWRVYAESLIDCGAVCSARPAGRRSRVGRTRRCTSPRRRRRGRRTVPAQDELRGELGTVASWRRRMASRLRL